MASITTNTIELSQSWGVQFGDYTMGDDKVDFQDLMVKISENRAMAVEKEVAPLTTRIKTRNKELEVLGSLLSKFSAFQAKFSSDSKGSDSATISGITDEEKWLCWKAYKRQGGTNDIFQTDLSWYNSSWSKSQGDGMVSALKSMIDERNNAAQTDMTRLQSLVDRRDESYSTATNLMSAVSDTRSNTISNM